MLECSSLDSSKMASHYKVNITALGTYHWDAASVCRTFSIEIRQLPEGGWGVVNSDIPGLNIEGDTEQEAKDEAKRWAHELLVDNGIIPPGSAISLVFRQ